jgi:hypothetical protein
MEQTQQQPVNTSLTLSDWIFLILVGLAVYAVVLLGHEAYKEGMKTEVTKRNGEQLAAWLTETGTQRFKPDFDVKACAGGQTPGAAPAEGPTPGTWGACFQHLMTQTEFKNAENPFFGEAPQFVAACVPSDASLTGMMVVEKSIPTPAGSAVPMITSQLMDTDPIDQKLQLRVSVCDKGSYAIKIAEFEF